MAAPNRVEIPSGMQGKLDAFRKRVWMIKLAEGALAAIFGLLLSYIAVFTLDRFMDTPSSWRLGILALGSVSLGIGFPLTCHRWVWGTRKMEQIAKLIRNRFPRFGDQLLGTIELAKDESEQRRSATLIQAAIDQVDQVVQERDLTDAVPNPWHRRWAAIVAVPAVAVIAAAIVLPLVSGNAFARWLTPWRDVDRYTFAQMEELPEEMVVPYAEKYNLSVALNDDSRWAPESGEMDIPGQTILTADKTKQNRYRFPIPPQTEDGSVKIKIGDAEQSVVIKPTLRPELKHVSAEIKLPEYLQRKGMMTTDVRGGILTLLKGSETQLEAVASRDLDSATVDGRDQDVEGDTILTSTFTAYETMEREITWFDKLGLSAKKPFKLRIEVVEDQHPNVQINDLKRQQVLLHTSAVDFAVFASDDFGLQRVGLEWEGVHDPLTNPNPTKGELLLSQGNPEAREMDVTTTFSPSREGIAPQVLRIRAFTQDFQVDSKRVYSPDFILFVMTPEEHAIYLTKQLAKWMRDADEVYQREQQLHQVNNELRQTPADELDSPEGRRRIERQAQAERANGAKLGALTKAGKGLLEEAATNDQFNISTLETWADMMNKLEDMANNRMPSISDMLTDASKAPGQPRKGGEGKSGKTPPSAGHIRDNKQGKGETPESDSENDQTPPAVVDVESGNNEVKDNEASQPPSQGGGRLSLPSTVVQGGGADFDDEETECPLVEKVEEAFKDQTQLLAEFEKIRDELQKLLGNLEGSTFVKRLKAASRRQLEVAGDLNATLSDTFGAEKEIDPRIKGRMDQIAEREFGQSESIYIIQEDLDAYYARVQEGKFKQVLDEMRDMNAVGELKEIGDTINVNLNGQSLVKAEFWADTLDRWAEQLVGPGCPGGT